MQHLRVEWKDGGRVHMESVEDSAAAWVTGQTVLTGCSVVFMSREKWGVPWCIKM